MLIDTQAPFDPELKFPCDYPIKVIGRQTETLYAEVVAVAEKYQIDFTWDRIRLRSSRKGNFVSMTVLLRVESADSLHAVHRDLAALSSVTLLL